MKLYWNVFYSKFDSSNLRCQDGCYALVRNHFQQQKEIYILVRNQISLFRLSIVLAHLIL